VAAARRPPFDGCVSAADRSLWDGDEGAGDKKESPVHACSAVASGRRAHWEDQSARPIGNGSGCTVLVWYEYSQILRRHSHLHRFRRYNLSFTLQRFDSLQANFTCSSNPFVPSQSFDPSSRGFARLTDHTPFAR
jgi:hypothetical protein